MSRQIKTIWRGHGALLISFGAVLGFSIAGCSAIAPKPTGPTTIAPRVFLGGEALAQKKLRMRRAHADLAHLYVVHERLSRLQKNRERNQLEAFIRPYLEHRVRPLIHTPAGQGWNGELRLLEANLLFAEAALFVAMGDDEELGVVIATLSDRFDGYESMLIEYPIGDSSTLELGVKDLRTNRGTL